MLDDTLKPLITELVQKNTLLQAILSSPRNKASPQKIMVRPIEMKNKMVYQFSHYYQQQVKHENISSSQCISRLMELISTYKQTLLHTSTEDYHLLINKKGIPTILRKSPSEQRLKTLSHNRKKNYILNEDSPLPFLVELGVMSSTGKIFSDKRDKFRQINRFLETIKDIIPHLIERISDKGSTDKTIRIIDFGCGKAYLTFALYHFLHLEKKYDIEIVGLDLKSDVVNFCQTVADKLHFSHLHFVHGDIKDYSNQKPVDLVICLHACDTATDDALEKAVGWQAQVIMAVPCCQHELFNQIECKNLNPLLTHGILKERFAALATDAARSQILEILGYKTQVLEFIDIEHTPKNLMIRAVKQKNEKKINKEKLIKNYKDFKKLLNIKPSIEKMISL